MKKAFVVSFEHLPACMLGCYGHQWIETPNFDRLASLSVLFDQHFANDLCTTQNSFPWWTGQTIPQAFEASEPSSDSFIPELKKKGIHSTLLLESDKEAGRNVSARAQEKFFNHFDQVETIAGLNGYDVSEADTPIAKLMQAAIDRLPAWMENSKEQLIWIRSEGVPLEPLAPEFFSTLYLDEVLDQGELEAELANEVENSADQSIVEDVDAAFSEADESVDSEEADLIEEDWQELITVVSELFLNPEEWAELDDQERLMARAVYAGYVTLLDQWLGRFLDQLLEYAADHQILLIVTAGRGGCELLGPVRQVGNGGLFDETSHVPLFIYDSKNPEQGNRQQFLSQSADIPVSLSSWFGVPLENYSRTGNNLFDVINDQNSRVAPVIYTASDHAIGLRTDEFYYLELQNQSQSIDLEENEILDEEPSIQIYQKPADRWDVFELHTQLPEIVAQYSTLLNEKRTK